MQEREDIVALVVAAGNGSRAGGYLPKQFQTVAGATVIAHAIDRLVKAGIERLVLVIGAGQETLLAQSIGARSVSQVVVGGATRQESVRNGLTAIAAAGGANVVLIHDAARPFLPPTVVDRLLGALKSSPGAVPVLPVVDSLASGDEYLGAPVSRAGVVRVQTPQAFRFDSIFDAHQKWDGAQEATDDAQVARAAGYAVECVEGDAMLEKVTYIEDFARMEAVSSVQWVSRTGLGYDVHAFDEGQGVWLAGVLLPHDRRLKGHSDADVALHAITDALLGALCEGDIGDHFPPTDAQWKGAPSSIFIEHAARLVRDRGGRIDHVDVTIICEAPRVGPHRASMRHSLASLLGIRTDQVSVKATTSEGLGFTGRREGIAAQAVATIRIPDAQ